jgi:hypothetical protein
MTGFFEDGVLRFMGLDDDDISALNDRLPDIQNLLTLVQTHQAQFNRVLTTILPMAQKVIAKQRDMK